MLTFFVFCCVMMLVSVFNLAAYTSFESPLPSFIEAALIGAIFITAIIVTKCVKEMLSGGFTRALALIAVILILFPLGAGRLYMLSDGIVVTVIYYILHWAWIIIYTIVGLIPAIVYFIFNVLFSLTPMSEEAAFYAAMVIAAIIGLIEGGMAAENIVYKFGRTYPDIAGRAEIINSDGKSKDIFFYK
ncbi:MAG: hypothetical protein LUE25_05885 [Clostridiales bacterium]|nr:hypothetical protein [Clostridiales bacterium]